MMRDVWARVVTSGPSKRACTGAGIDLVSREPRSGPAIWIEASNVKHYLSAHRHHGTLNEPWPRKFSPIQRRCNGHIPDCHWVVAWVVQGNSPSNIAHRAIFKYCSYLGEQVAGRIAVVIGKDDYLSARL
jgi:hypothetical protein